MEGIVKRRYDQCRAEWLRALVETRVYSRDALVPALWCSEFSQMRDKVARLVIYSAELERNGLLPRFVEVSPERL